MKLKKISESQATGKKALPVYDLSTRTTDINLSLINIMDTAVAKGSCASITTGLLIPILPFAFSTATVGRTGTVAINETRVDHTFTFDYLADDYIILRKILYHIHVPDVTGAVATITWNTTTIKLDQLRGGNVISTIYTRTFLVNTTNGLAQSYSDVSRVVETPIKPNDTIRLSVVQNWTSNGTGTGVISVSSNNTSALLNILPFVSLHVAPDISSLTRIFPQSAF